MSEDIFPCWLKQLVALPVKQLEAHEIRVTWTVPHNNALYQFFSWLKPYFLVLSVCLHLTCRPIFKHKVVHPIILSIEHSHEVVVVSASLFWWAFTVLHFSDGFVGVCESFLELFLLFFLCFERKFIEIFDCLLKSFSNKINQLLFRRANALSLPSDYFNLFCKLVNQWLNGEFVEFLQICLWLHKSSSLLSQKIQVLWNLYNFYFDFGL